YGLKKTTMTDIAKAAGKSKGTLYYYFKDKEDIFDKVIKLEIHEVFQTVKTAVDKQPDAINMLKTYIITKIKTLREKTNLFRLVIEDDPHGHMNKKFRGLRNKYDKEERIMIKHILSKGVANNLLTDNILTDIDVISNLLVSCVRGIALDIIVNNRNSILPEKADLLIEILI